MVEADLNGDGIPDLIVSQPAQRRQRAVGQRQRHLPGAADVRHRQQSLNVTVADLKGNGIPDLIVTNYGSNTVSVLLGNGNGTFQNQVTFAAGGDTAPGRGGGPDRERDSGPGGGGFG